MIAKAITYCTQKLYDEFKESQSERAETEVYKKLGKISEDIDQGGVYSTQDQIDKAIKDIIRRDQKPNAKPGDLEKLRNLTAATVLLNKN